MQYVWLPTSIKQNCTKMKFYYHIKSRYSRGISVYLLFVNILTFYYVIQPKPEAQIPNINVGSTQNDLLWTDSISCFHSITSNFTKRRINVFPCKESCTFFFTAAYVQGQRFQYPYSYPLIMPCIIFNVPCNTNIQADCFLLVLQRNDVNTKKYIHLSQQVVGGT